MTSCLREVVPSYTTREFKERYKKGIKVLEEIRLGNSNRERLLKNKLSKGDLEGTATKVFRVISLLAEKGPALLLLSSYRPYSTSFYFLKRTFL